MATLFVGLVRSDRNGTVLATGNHAMVYTSYGFRESLPGSSVLGFNGQMLDLGSGCYLLGNGRRMYNPALMRFTAVDTLSPFGKGGVNAYAYCLSDPVNNIDPSGNIPFFGLKLPKLVRVFLKQSRAYRAGARAERPVLPALNASKARRAEKFLKRKVDDQFFRMRASSQRQVLFASTQPDWVGYLRAQRNPDLTRYLSASRDYSDVERALSYRPASAAVVNDLPPTYEALFGKELPPPTYQKAMAANLAIRGRS